MTRASSKPPSPARPRCSASTTATCATFAVDLETSVRLARLVPAGRRIVAESGIRTAADIARLGRAGIRAFLVGEQLMQAADPAAALALLKGGAP